ncbi:OmpA family protein [Arcobacter vandammei]|uniref:OmpA family protein n=1 Tax=Arcobacter vandammei TaxID=2782243 RepID=UPI0018E04837|nr:OmpA family protein [Arcobacter vandammei]
MSFFKKIFYLLLIFLVLNIITVYNFDYRATNSEDSNFFTSINKKLSSIFDKKVESTPFSFVVEKSDDILKLSAILANESDAKTLLNALKIDKEIGLTYKDGVVIDYLLLEKIKPFIEEFKKSAINGSKIVFDENGLKVNAEIKDEDSITILDELNKKNHLNASLDMKVLVKNQDMINQEIEDVKHIVETNLKKDEIQKEVIPTIEDIQNQINNILKENKITFARASTNLTPESLKTIENIVNILKNYNYLIEVGGHTDSKGNPTLNQQLSDKRAASVKNSLIKFGINKDLVKSFGYGNQFPIAQEDELGLSEENRRVEILLKEKGSN